MTTPTLTAVTIADRNETKCLFSWGFVGTPSPRDPNMLDFVFDATESLFEARRAYSQNAPVPVLSFIAASRYVDKAVFEHRQREVRDVSN